MKRVAVLIATAGGAGYAPVASGTFGSAVGVLVYWLTSSWPFAWQACLALLVTVVGTWASSLAATHFDREDPSQVVIDEVAGQLVTYLGVGVGIWGVLLGFLAFRAFDIVKPWPANRLEHLPGGAGIMADDIMAGIYANILLQAVVRFVYPGL